MKTQQTKLEIPLQTKSLTLRLNEELYNKLMMFKSIYNDANQEQISLSELIRKCIEYTLEETKDQKLLTSAFVTHFLLEHGIKE